MEVNNFKKIIDYLSSFSSEERGKIFERYCKWFLENDPRYSNQLKQIWLWKDWPHNWGRDKGIDLIAETFSGSIWAIQVKAYDEIYSVTKEDIDKFLSETSRKAISFRLLIATTNNIGSNAQEVINGQEKPVSLCLLNQLEKASLDWSNVLTNSKVSSKRKTHNPYPHQEEAIQGILKGFENFDRGQVHMACGTGKTLVGLWVTEKLKAQKTLVLVPSISLVTQLYSEWANNSSEKFNPIFVCSDETVGNKDEDTEDVVENAINLGFPVTTNAVELIEQLNSNSDKVIIFSTYHSSPVIKKACELNPALNFDFVIADEAHRCAGKAESYFATIVNRDVIRASKKLFMTATPKFFSGNVKKKTKELECEIVSMDDAEKFGPVFYRLPFSEAIKRELLSDYQVLISVMDNKTYQEYAERGRFVTINDIETDARTLASQILIAKAIKRFGLKKVISFHSRKSNARDFINTFSKANELIPQNERPEVSFLQTIFGEMPQSKRDVILKQFKEATKERAGLIANVKCLSEGVDVPALDGVAFIDPKGSEIDIIQSVGRAIRKSKNKIIGTIIIPIFIDNITDEEEAFEQSCFKPIWKVLKALRAHDDILTEELDNIRLELGKRVYKKPAQLTKVVIEVPCKINTEFVAALNLEIVQRSSNQWEYPFGLLLRYIDQYGQAIVPSDFIMDDYNLGSWVSIQRKSYKKKELPLLYIERLEKLNGWVWDVLDARWEYGFYLLCEYFKNNKHIQVPRNFKINGFDLSSWILVQRRAFKKGKLSLERRKKLESVPEWLWNIPDNRMQMALDALISFNRREHHLDVAHNHIENGFRLGGWIRHQRKLFQKGKLSVNMQNFFMQFADWSWENDLGRLWKKNYFLLSSFVKNYGHAQVPKDYKIDNINLGIWVSGQRHAFKNNKLSPERIKKLESLPNWSWGVLDSIESDAFKSMDLFVKREGHALVPTAHVEGSFELGKWVSRQRLYYSRKNLEQSTITKLESYQGWYWNANEGYWELFKKLLLKFIKREGHAVVKNGHKEEGYDLGRLVQMYRYKYKKGTLSQNKIDFFEGLDNWSWGVMKDRWNKGLHYLRLFYEREGHARVPANHNENGFTLGTWTCTQKYNYTKQILPENKIKILESFSGWTWPKRLKKIY